jgi:hypothetical protein
MSCGDVCEDKHTQEEAVCEFESNQWVLDPWTRNRKLVFCKQSKQNPSLSKCQSHTSRCLPGLWGGTLSLFNTDDQSVIYTLTHQSEGLLRPYIQRNAYEVKNVAPIVICPVSQRNKLFFKLSPDPPTWKIKPSIKTSIPFICRNMSQKSHTSHSPLGTKVSFPDPEPCTAYRDGF